MTRLRHILVLLFLLVAAAYPLAAAESPATPEDQAFQSTAESFRGHFFERAEKESGEFIKAYPTSPRLPEVVLILAQSQIQQRKYAEAIQLLSSTATGAGKLADEHLFWLAEALNRKGDFAVAADVFGRVVKEHPGSPRCLEALISEAAARSKGAAWSQVVALLTQTNTIFQVTATSVPTNSLVVRGFLLLGEAYLAQGDYAAAAQALRPLSTLALPPAVDWQRQYLICRVQLSQGQAAEALQTTTNLLALATNSAQPSLQADSAAFQGSVFERLARYDEAIGAYQRNLAPGVSLERQRQALLKIAELSIAQNQLARAIEMLEKFATQFPDAPAVDLVLLTLGELRVRQHLQSVPDTAPATAATNSISLTNAVEAFRSLVSRYPQSPLAGKAHLNLGWCFWLAGTMPAAENAFSNAVQRLPESPDLAIALFKLADSQFQQKDYTNALKHYSIISAKLSSLDEVKTNLLERALYQMVQAGRAASDLGAISNALSQILALYPTGFHADRALLVAGAEIKRAGNPAAARELFLWARTNAPQESLLPELELAIARTYEQESNWLEVMRQYDFWLARFTNHQSRAKAQYALAVASFQAGYETNAFRSFTNFVSRFPQDELAPLAHWWLADYFFRNGEPLEAEKRYQLLFRSTNWAPSRLTYQAQLMAGRAAMARLAWQDVSPYLINLYKDTNCPTDLRIQALFSFGDYCMSRDSTNKLADYDDAISAFNGVHTWEPTNRLAVLALGKIASCYMQKAQFLSDYQLAITNFQQVIQNPMADATARSIAKVGIGLVLRKQAELVTAQEQTIFRKQALDHFLDVFYRKVLRPGEQPDLFWTRKAGLEAAETAEALQDWDGALSVYQQLIDFLPQLRPRLEKNILKAQREKLARNQG